MSRIEECINCYYSFIPESSRYGLLCQSCGYEGLMSSYEFNKIHFNDTEVKIIKERCIQQQTMQKYYYRVDVYNKVYEYYKNNNREEIKGQKEQFMVKYDTYMHARKPHECYKVKKDLIIKYINMLLLKLNYNNITNISNTLNVLNYIDRTFHRYVNRFDYDARTGNIPNELHETMTIMDLTMHIFKYINDNIAYLRFHNAFVEQLNNKINTTDFGYENEYWRSAMYKSHIYIECMKSIGENHMRNNVTVVCNQFYDSIYNYNVKPYKQQKDNKIELDKLLKEKFQNEKDYNKAIKTNYYYDYTSRSHNRVNVQEMFNNICYRLIEDKKEKKVTAQVKKFINDNFTIAERKKIPSWIRYPSFHTYNADNFMKEVNKWYNTNYNSDKYRKILDTYKINKKDPEYAIIYNKLLEGKLKEEDINKEIGKNKRIKIINDYINSTYKRNENIAKLDVNYQRYIDGIVELDIFKISVENVVNNLNYETKCFECNNPVIVANIIFTESNHGPYCFGCFALNN